MIALHTVVLAVSISLTPEITPTVTPTVTAEGRHADAIDGMWEAHLDRSALYLNVRVERPRGFYHYGGNYKINDLDEYRREKRVVGFELHRKAGTIRFDGSVRDARGRGRYEFTPHDGFKRALEKMGFRGLESERLLTIALHDISLQDVRYLERAVAGTLTTADLVKLLEYGVDPDFVRRAIEERGELMSVPELIRLRTGGHAGD